MAVNVKREIKSFREKLRDALYEAGKEVFENNVNPRYPQDNLGDSDLAKSFDVKRDGKGFVFFLNDYYVYIEHGRRPTSFQRKGKGQGKSEFFESLLKWIKKKNVRFRDKKGRFITFRSTAFIIMKSIDRKGLPKRPFLDDIVSSAQETALEFVNLILVDDLFDRIIINELEKLD